MRESGRPTEEPFLGRGMSESGWKAKGILYVLPNDGEPGVKFLTRLRLLEAKNGEGKDWEVVVIETGVGKNNRSYAADVLKDARHLYEDCPVYLFELGKKADHLPDSMADEKPRLIKHLVGWLRKPLFKTFSDGGKTREGILANFHVDKGSQWLRDKLLDAWKSGVKNLFGFSHDASGDITKFQRFGIEMESVDKITDVSSVELVTNPAQGGQLLRLLASANGGNGRMKTLMERLLGIFRKIDEALIEGIDESAVTDEQFLALVEAGVENEKFLGEAKALEAHAPFMKAIVERVIGLLKGDKKEAAIKALTSLQDKLKSEGYGEPKKETDPSKHDDNPLTVDDLFPENVNESAYSDCMKREMKAGKSMADAAKVCKVEAKKEEPAKESAYTDCVAREVAKGKTQAEAETVCKLEGKKEDKTAEALARITKVEESIKKEACTAVLNRTLTESTLFTPVLDKIRAQFEGKVFKTAELTEALKAEQDTLAALSESGNLKGLGQTKVQVTLDESDKKQIAMDLMFDVDVKDKKGVGAFRSIREAYRSMNPLDPNITFTNQRSMRLTEATAKIADFDNALGTSLTRKMLKVYKLLPLPWKEFCNIVPVDNFKQQERIRWGGFGELPTVAEDAAYADVAFPTDESASYTALTKGGLFAISRKVIKNDDMNMLRQVPTRLARAAAKTLNTYVWANLIANNVNIYDGAVPFITGRGNLGSDALDFDSLDAAVTAQKGMLEKGNYTIEGTATGGASGTLIDSGAPFGGSSEQVGYFVRIVYGTGVGQVRTISSHNTTTLTLSSNWTVTVSTDSKYEVFQYADEKIGIQPGWLAVPTELESTGRRILMSDLEPDTVENNINVMKGIAKLMVVGALTDANDWYLIADKTWLDMFEVGFIDGAENPTILVQDQPNVGATFTRDRITYKVRHEYGAAMTDYRGFYKAVVS